MFTPSHLIAAGLLALIGFVSLPAATQAQEQSQGPRLEIVVHEGADERWSPVVAADHARFAEAGIGTFDVEVHIWDSSLIDSHCHGHRGVFVPGAPNRVELCADFVDGDLAEHLRHKLVLHELAHAWTHVHLTAGERVDYVAMRGAPSWSDPAHTHFTRGTELAANTLMYALHPDAPNNPDHICGYVMLTGVDVPNGRGDACATI